MIDGFGSEKLVFGDELGWIANTRTLRSYFMTL
jgi:hypothetical protein